MKTRKTVILQTCDCDKCGKQEINNNETANNIPGWSTLTIIEENRPNQYKSRSLLNKDLCPSCTDELFKAYYNLSTGDN